MISHIMSRDGYAPLSEAHVEGDDSDPDVLCCLLVYITQLKPRVVLKGQVQIIELPLSVELYTLFALKLRISGLPSLARP